MVNNLTNQIPCFQSMAIHIQFSCHHTMTVCTTIARSLPRSKDLVGLFIKSVAVFINLHLVIKLWFWLILRQTAPHKILYLYCKSIVHIIRMLMARGAILHHALQSNVVTIKTTQVLCTCYRFSVHVSL